MKKLIPFVLGVWVIAVVGCTTTTTERQRQPSASVDPTVFSNRSERLPNRGPR